MPASNRRARSRLHRLARLWTCLLVLTIVVALAAGTTTTTAIHAQNAAASRADAPVATAIRFALAQLGKPYQWGGTGPNSFDCSGLTMRAYQAAGISIPRVSRDQYRAGRHVPLGQLIPGDLVFYTHAEESKLPAGIGHVAMYLGRGRLIEAAHRGVPIRIASIRRPNLVAVATRPTTGSPGLLPVQYRQRGGAVRVVQARLAANRFCLAVDGVFGPITRRAVRRFQAAHGLAADAVVGPRTWGALVSFGRMHKPTTALLTPLPGSEGPTTGRMRQIAPITFEAWLFWLGCALRAAPFRCRRRAQAIPIRGIDPIVCGQGWYAHVDGEAAVRAGCGVDVAAVGVGHGANDG